MKHFVEGNLGFPSEQDNLRSIGRVPKWVPSGFAEANFLCLFILEVIGNGIQKRYISVLTYLWRWKNGLQAITC